MTTLFALFAEAERDLISERTLEGLAQGQVLGPEARPPEGVVGRLTARRQGGRTRQLPARPEEGEWRRARRLEARPPGPQPRPSRQHRSRNLSARGVGLRVLAGQGAQTDTTAAGRLMFGIFAALAEFERELIRERTVAGLKAARTRGRKGVRKIRAVESPRCGWPRPRWPTATRTCRASPA